VSPHTKKISSARWSVWSAAFKSGRLSTPGWCLVFRASSGCAVALPFSGELWYCGGPAPNLQVLTAALTTPCPQTLFDERKTQKSPSKLWKGLEMELSGTELAWCVGGPGFRPQHPKRQNDFGGCTVTEAPGALSRDRVGRASSGPGNSFHGEVETERAASTGRLT
jgi:hypothetical protein